MSKYTSKENLTEALGLVSQAIPFRKGTGKDSIVAMSDKNGSTMPTASNDYSIAVGTNDTSILGDLESVASSQINAVMPESTAPLAAAIGLSTKAQSSGALAIGIQTVAGVKGFYWYTITINSDNTATISLSKKQSMSTGLLGSIEVVSSNDISDWAVGDYISIVNNQKYSYCAKITGKTTVSVKAGLSNKTTAAITVDASPFGADAYGALSSFTAAPDDKSIFAIGRTQNNTTLAHTLTPRNGSVELGWGAQAFGLNNVVSGSFATAFGANNYQAGDFGLISGRDNVGAYGNLVIGGWNTSTGLHSGVIGRLLTNTNNYNFLAGYNNSLKSAQSAMFGWDNIDESKYGNIIAGRENKVLAGNTNAVFGGRYDGSEATAGHGNTVSGLGNLIAGYSNSITGNFSLLQGAFNTTSKSYTYHLGRKLKSSREYQIVIGRNNKEDSTALFIIGNGTSDDVSAESNALTVSSSGLLTTNDITINGASTTANINSTKTIKFTTPEVRSTANIYAQGRVTALKNFVSGGASNKISENSNYNIISGSSNTLNSLTSVSDPNDGNIIVGNSNTISDGTVQVKNSALFGRGLKTNTSIQTVVGKYNSLTPGYFVVGVGDSESTRDNGLVVDSDGITTKNIYSRNIDAELIYSTGLETSGNIIQYLTSRPNITSGSSIIASGDNITISGSNVLSVGTNLSINGNYNAIIGSGHSVNNSNYNILIGSDHDVEGSHNLLMGHNNACCGGFNALFGYDIQQIHDSEETEEHCSIGAGCETSFKGQCQLFGGKHHTIIGRSNLTAGEHQEITGKYNVCAGYYNKILPVDSVDGNDDPIVITGNNNAVFGSTNIVRRGNNLISGGGNEINGNYNLIAGYKVKQAPENSENCSFGGGNEITFSGKCNIFGGSYQNIKGNYNAVFGDHSDAYCTSSIIAGSYNKSGEKIEDSAGNITYNTVSYNAVFGFNNKSIGNYNSVSGGNNITDGSYDNISGYSNESHPSTGASDNKTYNVVAGHDNIVSGRHNIAVGSSNKITNATGSSVFGASHEIKTNHNYSALIGYDLTSTANGQLIVGTLNQTENTFNNDAFVVAYGTTSEKKTIFTVPKTSVKSAEGSYYAKPTKDSDAITLGYFKANSGGVDEERVKDIIEEVLLNGVW